MSHKTAHRLRTLKDHFDLVTRSTNSTTNQPEKSKIELNPAKALIDEQVQIRISGLSRGEKVTLHACFEDGDRLYGACGHYIANEDGKVDTFSDVSYGGSFTGLEPMGLFWSKKPAFGKAAKRIIKDVTTPIQVHLGMESGFQLFEDLDWTGHISNKSCILNRSYMAPGVIRVPVKEDGFEGTLFIPKGQGPFPAVLDVFGLNGGELEMRPSLLAGKGFVTLFLNYFKDKVMPRDGNFVDFNVFLKAFDWLAAHPAVDPNALGATSTCVGGSFVFMLASKRPKLRCIVSHNNPGILHGHSQVVEGELMKAFVFNWSGLKQSKEDWTGIHIEGGADLTYPEVWRHGAKVLVQHGLDDKCVIPEVVHGIKQSIPKEFLSHFTFVLHPGAGHFLEPPYMPLCSHTKLFDEKDGKKAISLFWGGNPKQHADAQESAWKKTIAFFSHHLKNDSSLLKDAGLL